jgi:hypothetical protein
VESLDVVKYVGLGHIERWVLMPVNSSTLVHAEEFFN